MEPGDRVVLFAHPRSGSSSLFQILQLHPALDLLEEPFNEHFHTWEPGNPNYLERVTDEASFDGVLGEIFGTYDGLKVLHYQLDPRLMERLLLRPDCRIVFLRRRNVLRSVVSVLIAHQTELWKMWDRTEPLERYYEGLRPLDVEEVRDRIAALRRDMARFEAVLDARDDGRVVQLTYEDLYVRSPRETLSAVWRGLDVEPVPDEQADRYLSPAMRLNPPEMYAYLPNAEEIEEACGGDATGRLFEEDAEPETRFTERLRLEPIGPHHADDLWRLHQDDAVAEWWGKWTREAARRNARDWGEAWARDGVHKWIAYDRETGELVGRGGLSRMRDDHGTAVRIRAALGGDAWDGLEVGWTVRGELWGRGYATEIGRAGLAFATGELGASMVVAFTETHNARSRAVMERLGMREVGDIVHDGEPFVLYATGGS